MLMFKNIALNRRVHILCSTSYTVFFNSFLAPDIHLYRYMHACMPWMGVASRNEPSPAHRCWATAMWSCLDHALVANSQVLRAPPSRWFVDRWPQLDRCNPSLIVSGCIDWESNRALQEKHSYPENIFRLYIYCIAIENIAFLKVW